MGYLVTLGLNCIARLIIGCHSTQVTTVQMIVMTWRGGQYLPGPTAEVPDPAAAAAAGVLPVAASVREPVRRGLHWFTLGLNLSNSRAH